MTNTPKARCQNGEIELIVRPTYNGIINLLLREVGTCRPVNGPDHETEDKVTNAANLQADMAKLTAIMPKCYVDRESPYTIQ